MQWQYVWLIFIIDRDDWRGIIFQKSRKVVKKPWFDCDQAPFLLWKSYSCKPGNHGRWYQGISNLVQKIENQ